MSYTSHYVVSLPKSMFFTVLTMVYQMKLHKRILKTHQDHLKVLQTQAYDVFAVLFAQILTFIHSMSILYLGICLLDEPCCLSAARVFAWTAAF